MNPTEITVCTICVTCRRPGTQRDSPADGLALFLAVQAAADAALFDAPDAPQVLVRGQSCMSGCSRACTMSLQAQGKHSYYFGDLMADEESVAQVLVCAQLHQSSLDGHLARHDRPERVRSGILARLPAVETQRAATALERAGA